ncbi:MurR/RpiR family transcriptional regulator [Enterococcus saccharolyticus]|uniref:Phosphosugar-binding transcriptional regulator n=1 Tax=Enterococcus saccharolyticus subsp. saccharolyticus ATCC 43076 TaxID=1139996 RepID=S0NIB4_9ENTE|nr:MurR/RpiR family transcriptional regulator [Enterococcus saccharolyticus]EOT26303.1 phosphosugar-binding transcriptional regulator [Enterococcus saccharolyticus subsp. saccharolyticus ATCC 43076]EOT76263.1 phosphosugar-binding transcriptional regulator [Enterococcus saccharolyticus subsp. saccharolyticus ATCC 43076]OJG85242.1 phosphosugar-binding transcriptional regulator [Enterococcus saccharolyticus]
MNIEMLIEKYQLNNAEAQVLRYMQENKHALKQMGIREVAKQSFVSTATIVNMSKKIGFSGYSELVFFFQNELTPPTPPTYQVVSKHELQQFTHLLTKYKDKRIMILGFGFSQNLANYFAESLNLYGFRATANGHLEFLRESVEDDMLIIVISNSGETRRLLELTRTAAEHRLEVIAFVGERYSSVGSLARLTISSNTYSPRSFQEFAPSLFFGTALNQFELLLSEALKSIFN